MRKRPPTDPPSPSEEEKNLPIIDVHEGIFTYTFHEKSSNGSSNSKTATTPAINEDDNTAVKAEASKQAALSVRYLLTANNDILLIALTDLGYPSTDAMSDLTKLVATVEDEIITVTRAVSDNENLLKNHYNQHQQSPTINSMKTMIEDAVSAAVDAVVIHAMARKSLDLSIKDNHLLFNLNASFLRHSGTRNPITRFTWALVEQTMNEYLMDQAAHMRHRKQKDNKRSGDDTDSSSERSLNEPTRSSD